MSAAVIPQVGDLLYFTSAKTINACGPAAVVVYVEPDSVWFVGCKAPRNVVTRNIWFMAIPQDDAIEAPYIVQHRSMPHHFFLRESLLTANGGLLAIINKLHTNIIRSSMYDS